VVIQVFILVVMGRRNTKYIDRKKVKDDAEAIYFRFWAFLV